MDAESDRMEDGERRNVAVGFLLLGLLAGLVGFFANWWTVTVTGAGANSAFRARPFATDTSGEFVPQWDEALGTHVLYAGLLTVVAVFALGAAVYVTLLSRGGPHRPAVWHYGPTSVGLVVGLLATLLAMWLWPIAWTDKLNALTGNNPELHALWSGSETITSGSSATTLSYAPGLGWYLSLVGFLLLPAVALWLLRPLYRKTAA